MVTDQSPVPKNLNHLPISLSLDSESETEAQVSSKEVSVSQEEPELWDVSHSRVIMVSFLRR